ncbi:tRNA (adenosine(37)-N6)-dimethylallyltransferase MiaA [Patescibacteria group bacterium]|nr:tRNA (adenosine(37)-N6)-dimethylallyltransferase MiaA [Patescibacteria group bacterium]
MPKKSILPKVIIIVGPTASGKSALAVKLAKKFNGEVVSADSRQVYRGLDIGTGKVTPKEMAGIPHHLLDVVSPKRAFTVARYKRLAERAIKDILRRGKLPIICGGTGFYIQAVVDGLVLPEVPPNRALRKLLKKKGATELSALLKKLDPARWRSIDRKNPVRLIRAIEIAEAIGRVPKLKTVRPAYDALFIGVYPGGTALKLNIKKRLDERLRHGMIAEARKLRIQGLSLRRMEEMGLEYRHLGRLLRKKVTRTRMEDELYRDIVKYAKRQMTWFKRDKRIRWVKVYREAEFDVKGFLS